MKQFFILFHLSFSLVVQTVLVFSQCVGNYIIIIILLYLSGPDQNTHYNKQSFNLSSPRIINSYFKIILFLCAWNFRE